MQIHKMKASKAFQLLNADTCKAKQNPAEQHTICFDLQQTLPLPKLTSGPAFYKRKLWLYNLCIHDCGLNKGHMYLWPETIGGRGSNDIGSCILEYFKLVTPVSKKLVVYSDNCSGQNKNYNIVALWQYLVSSGKFHEIIHRFPIPGHTMMPCDRNFGDIERHLRSIETIYSPDEYAQHIAKSRVNNKFVVTQNDVK